MTYTLAADLILENASCCVCGIQFAAPRKWLQNRRDEGGKFYCPNGHELVFRQPETEKLREKISRLEASNRHLADQREAAERSNAALRGSNTKLRNRIANGVCPCCRRSFADLARHMAGQHPGYGDGGS